MHEVGAVASLIEAIMVEVQAHQPCTVDAVRVQRGSTFAEDALLQAWTMLCRETPLEDTRLDIEVVSHIVDCACGIERTMQAEDLVGHLWICVNCAHVEEVDEHDDLTLLGVTLTPLDVPVGAGSR